MRVALFWPTIAVASTAAAAAAAAATENLKGTYSLVGAQTCLVAPAGFKQDSMGNFTIPIGETNLSHLTTEGQVIYHGDGTGEARQTFVTIVPPPNPLGAAVSAGTLSYSFTYTAEGEHAYRMALKPGTFQGRLNAGPNAGQQFSIEGDSRLFHVSDDRKKITVAIDKPYVQKITFSGSSQPVQRVCTSISNQLLIDESATVGKVK
ncbi:hypothetical protein [Bradyrhizobium sp. CCBAU 25338]|uniref:hypothetical protein n=1 Tax=Bradyrhizobium sp. CCBAU 25338 TaxID=1641877 RepID=UPI002304D026|nr:hypothetical protein [Bradyrhizobium sp. CCBAU 25338]MDA9530426.1 hypothetical protein [Bradyrhizobium sp. CCBAU 25338]